MRSARPSFRPSKEPGWHRSDATANNSYLDSSVNRLEDSMTCGVQDCSRIFGLSLESCFSGPG
jgi:hypothetical protein